MEKAKQQPDNQRKSSIRKNIVYLVLSIPLIGIVVCVVIFTFIMGIVLIPDYLEARAVKNWEIPPETEVIDFETSGFYPLCLDEGCSYYARLYLVSNHSKSYLENFYRERYGDSFDPHIRVTKDENLQLQYGRPVYVVIVRWVD